MIEMTEEQLYYCWRCKVTEPNSDFDPFIGTIWTADDLEDYFDRCGITWRDRVELQGLFDSGVLFSEHLNCAVEHEREMALACLEE